MERAELRLKFRIARRRHFENSQRFIGGFDFALPTVNRMNLRDYVPAGGQSKLDQLTRESLSCFRIGKGAEGENYFVCHRSGRLQRGGAANPSAADNKIAVVNDRRLAGRNGLLRFVELNASAAVFQA